MQHSTCNRGLLAVTLKADTKKEKKIVKPDFIKMQNFCAAKDTQTFQRQLTQREMWASRISDKGPRIQHIESTLSSQQEHEQLNLKMGLKKGQKRKKKNQTFPGIEFSTQGTFYLSM